MRKKVGIIKRLFCLLLIFLLSINSFAAIVSDNDGSAFITKAEFDALKSSFQSQIDTYNKSIDSKIDGAIASYLAGIKLSTVEERSMLPKTDFKYVSVYSTDNVLDHMVGLPSLDITDYVCPQSSTWQGTNRVGCGAYRLNLKGINYKGILFNQLSRLSTGEKKQIADYATYGLQYFGMTYVTGGGTGFTENSGALFIGTGSGGQLQDQANTYLSAWGIGWTSAGSRNWTAFFRPQFASRVIKKVTSYKVRPIGFLNENFYASLVDNNNICKNWGTSAPLTDLTQCTYPTWGDSSYMTAKFVTGYAGRTTQTELTANLTFKNDGNESFWNSHGFSEHEQAKTSTLYTYDYNNLDEIINISSPANFTLNEQKSIGINSGLPLLIAEKHTENQFVVKFEDVSKTYDLWILESPFSVTETSQTWNSIQLKSPTAKDSANYSGKAYKVSSGIFNGTYVNNTDNKKILWIKWSDASALGKGGGTVYCDEPMKVMKLDN